MKHLLALLLLVSTATTASASDYFNMKFLLDEHWGTNSPETRCWNATVTDPTPFINQANAQFANVAEWTVELVEKWALAATPTNWPFKADYNAKPCSSIPEWKRFDFNTSILIANNEASTDKRKLDKLNEIVIATHDEEWRLYKLSRADRFMSFDAWREDCKSRERRFGHSDAVQMGCAVR